MRFWKSQPSVKQIFHPGKFTAPGMLLLRPAWRRSVSCNRTCDHLRPYFRLMMQKYCAAMKAILLHLWLAEDTNLRAKILIHLLIQFLNYSASNHRTSLFLVSSENGHSSKKRL
jgi:hypothetical protein